MDWRVRYIDPISEYKEIGASILEAVHAVFSNGEFILRDDLAEFEQRICDQTGAVDCVGVNSGYDALFLAMLLLKLAPGDEVILPSYTFIATAAAVSRAGGTPVFADIGEDLNIDPDHVERLVTSKTRALIPVHLNGIPCRMDRLCALADDHDFVVIEDAAQAFGSTLGDKHLGTFGFCGCFSLHPLKSLSVPGDGGFILTDDLAAADHLRCLRDHGRKDGHYVLSGVNSRLDNLHAAVANVKLDRFAEFAERRRRAADFYRKEFADLTDVRLLDDPATAQVVWSNFPIISQRTNELTKALTVAGVEVFRHFREPVHRLAHFQERDGGLPMTERLCEQVVYLPVHPFLTREDMAYVVEIVNKVMR